MGEQEGQLHKASRSYRHGCSLNFRREAQKKLPSLLHHHRHVRLPPHLAWHFAHKAVLVLGLPLGHQLDLVRPLI